MLLCVPVAGFADHCPDLKSIHLNQFGYYVAPGGWKSRAPGVSEQVVLHFREADAAVNIDTLKNTLQFCAYMVGYKNDEMV